MVKPKETGQSNGQSSTLPKSGKSVPRKDVLHSHQKVRSTKLSAREVALEVLTKVEEHQSYSNLQLNQTLQKHPLERMDAALATEIVYGTIQRMNTIDYFLERFVNKGLEKLQPWVRCLLRLSFYQLYYLERVPDHAIVNESVNISKKRGHQGISGMVNGILRSIIRQKKELVLPANLPVVKRIALQHSHPEWLVNRWIRQLGEQVTEQICEANNQAPSVSIRVNTMKHKREDMLHVLENNGIQAHPSSLAPSGIQVSGGGNMAMTPWFAQGEISIQDESSMLVAEITDPKPGMKVLDCCAAPGGKTAHLAEIMNDQGTIWACDLHEHKKRLIEDQADRLQLNSIHTLVMDATKLDQNFAKESFDCILLDAPCTGFGVIRRKPDLKWSKQEKEIGEISRIQHEILSSVQGLLRTGGILVYSTCTIEQEENEAMIRRFLQEQPQFTLEPIVFEGMPGEEFKEQASEGMIQIYPYQFHTDGFFIAKLRKQG